MHQYINSSSLKEKKIQYIFNFLTIFVLTSILVLGSAASSWNVYAQSNETNSQSEKVIQIIPETSSEENNGNANEQLLSGSGSTGNDSGSTENQIVDGESNASNESANSQPDNECLFDPSFLSRFFSYIIIDQG